MWHYHEELFRKKDKIYQMGGSEAVARQHQSGKWTTRERIAHFFDPVTFTKLVRL